MHKNIMVLPGDGIGPEVVAEALRVATRVNEIFGIQMQFTECSAGGTSIDMHGTPLKDEVLKRCLDSDAVIKGPFGGPKWDNLEIPIRPEKAILRLRKELDLYANLRPVKLFSALEKASTLKTEVIRGVDILIVRELTSDLYFGEPRGIFTKDGVLTGMNTAIYRDFEVQRIVQKAFDFARLRKKKVHSVDKSNVLESSQVWHKIADETAKQNPGIEIEHMLVDNCAMQLIWNPRQFDVIVTGNMFGDILSDEASMLTGSLGMLPSASIGGKTGMYEPSHGSAPSLAGQQKANPLATILSVAMMYPYSFQNPEAESMILQAVEAVLNEGFRTPDILEEGKKLVTTKQMGDCVLAKLVPKR